MRLFRERNTEPIPGIDRTFRQMAYGGRVPPEAERDALLAEKRAMRKQWRWMAEHPESDHPARKLELAQEMQGLAQEWGPSPAQPQRFSFWRLLLLVRMRRARRIAFARLAEEAKQFSAVAREEVETIDFSEIERLDVEMRERSQARALRSAERRGDWLILTEDGFVRICLSEPRRRGGDDDPLEPSDQKPS